MIIDANLSFIRGKDAAVTITPAIAIGQADLKGNSKGIVPYQGLILAVSAAEPAASLGVTLETSDTKDGAYETVQVYQTKTGVKQGQMIVNERLPQSCRNWVRLKFSAAVKVNAHLVLDSDKRYPMV